MAYSFTPPWPQHGGRDMQSNGLLASRDGYSYMPTKDPISPEALQMMSDLNRLYPTANFQVLCPPPGQDPVLVGFDVMMQQLVNESVAARELAEKQAQELAEEQAQDLAEEQSRSPARAGTSPSLQ